MVDPIVKHNVNLMLSLKNDGMAVVLMAKRWLSYHEEKKEALAVIENQPLNPFAPPKTMERERYDFTVVEFSFNPQSGKISEFLKGSALSPALRGEVKGAFTVIRKQILLRDIPKGKISFFFYNLFHREHPEVTGVRFPDKASKQARINIELSMKMYNGA